MISSAKLINRLFPSLPKQKTLKNTIRTAETVLELFLNLLRGTLEDNQQLVCIFSKFSLHFLSLEEWSLFTVNCGLCILHQKKCFGELECKH